MAQHDYVIANGTGAAVRSDLNGSLAAIVSNNSGATEPGTMYAYQWWPDTTTGLLKIRNAANNAWVTVGTLASTNLGLLPLAGGTMTGVLAVTAGTAALPGITPSGDPNTGISSAGSDQLAISTGGTSRLAFSNTAISAALAVDVALGAVGTPSLTFTGDLNTGIYSPGADQVAITTAGVQRVNFNAATEVVFNDGGADVDFRIEGDTNASLFKIDAGLDEVQVANLNGGPIAGTRNRIINGDMRIDQRNAGAAVTNPSTYTLDRWSINTNLSSVCTIQQNAGSVTPPAGFTNYLGATSTAATSLSTANYFQLRQPVEGFNSSDLAWGTANAKTVTVSFWAYSSLTGTFSGSIRNNPNFTYAYPFSYLIPSANTWTYVTVTIPGPNASQGTWNTNNTSGLEVLFCLGAGTSLLSSANSWQAGTFSGVTSSVQILATNGATFYLTGVQLEPGTVATPFERRSFGQELALCQRYFQNNGAILVQSVAMFGNTMYLPVAMRATPTVVGGGTGFTSGGTTASYLYCYQTTSASQTLTLSAEL